MTIASGRCDAAATTGAGAGYALLMLFLLGARSVMDKTIIPDLFPAIGRATAALHVFFAGRDVANDLKVIADA